MNLVGSLSTESEKEKGNIKLIFLKKKGFLKMGNEYFKLHLSSNLERHKDSFLKYNQLVISNDFISNSKLLNLKAMAFSNLAGVYAQDSSYSLAENYANKAIKIHREENDELSEAAALSNLANIFVYQKKYNKAKKIYRKGLELIEYNTSNVAIQFKESLYENLGYAMYKLKDYKAYEIQELSYDIKDSLRNVDIRRMIEEVNGEYNVDNVRQAEELKRMKIQNEKEASQKNTWIVGVTGLCTALLLLYLANYYKLRQKNLSLMLSKKELLQNKELDKLKTESQVKILNATMDGKEEERKEIAEILHDNVSALLSSADLHLQASQSQFNGSTPIEIHKTQKIILEASQKIRDLSHTLVSSILLKFGLEYAIKDMAEKFTNSVLEVHTDIGNVRRYDQKSEIKIYNIIQELVNNIIKHSKASNAYVYLNEEEESLTIAIRDDGDGFDMDSAHIKDGVGLNQIKARVHMMEGLFVMNSSEGAGTKTEITVPVTPREKISHV